jgi:hypothetical protein
MCEWAICFVVILLLACAVGCSVVVARLERARSGRGVPSVKEEWLRRCAMCLVLSSVVLWMAQRGSGLRVVQVGGGLGLDHLALACLPAALGLSLSAVVWRERPVLRRVLNTGAVVAWLICLPGVLEPYVVWMVREFMSGR